MAKVVRLGPVCRHKVSLVAMVWKVDMKEHAHPFRAVKSIRKYFFSIWIRGYILSRITDPDPGG
jgi:hypothetical protein